MALMEFLVGSGSDVQLADMLESYAPEGVFGHALTGKFVQAYVREARGESGAVASLGGSLSAPEARSLEDVFLAQEKASLSELAPRSILEDFLRRVWVAAVRRKLGGMPVGGDADLEHRRRELSMLMRKFKSAPWKVASASMRLSSIDA